MTQKLTAQRAALYYGCDVTTKYDEGKSYKMVGLSTDMGNLQVLTGGGDTDWWNIDICQLLLTPLEKITDEHILMISGLIQFEWGFFGDKPVSEYRAMAELKDCLISFFSAKCVQDAIEEIAGLQVRDLIDRLRSLGYDVDNSIQDGWAVDKTTLI